MLFEPEIACNVRSFFGKLGDLRYPIVSRHVMRSRAAIHWSEP